MVLASTRMRRNGGIIEANRGRDTEAFGRGECHLYPRRRLIRRLVPQSVIDCCYCTKINTIEYINLAM